jgi:hypothetical protein
MRAKEGEEALSGRAIHSHRVDRTAAITNKVRGIEARKIFHA